MCAGVLLESARIYHFKGISKGKWRFCSTIEMLKCHFRLDSTRGPQQVRHNYSTPSGMQA